MNASRVTRRAGLRNLAVGAGAAASGAVWPAACGAPGANGPAAGGSGSQSLAPARISFWARGTQEFTDMMASVAKAYTQAYPQITVEGGYFPSDGWTDRIVASAASDSLPDVYHMDSQNVVSLATKGIAADVAALLAKDPKVKKADFFPWAFLRAEKDGKIYAMPFKGTCNVIWANQGLFDRFGVALPKAPWTWAQFVEAARKLTKDTDAPTAVWGTWERYPWQTAIWQNGGDLVDKEGKKPLIAEGPAADAVQWVADLALKEHVAPRSGEAPAIRGLSFAPTSGQIAMFPGAEPDFGNYLKITDYKWTALPMPLAVAGKPQASHGASTLYGLSPKSKVQAQAWSFLAWICTQKEPQGILNSAGKMGVPPYKPIYDALFLQEPRTDVKKVLGEMALANHPYLEGQTTVLDIEKVFSTELGPVWSGQATARDGTRKIADQIAPLLGR